VDRGAAIGKAEAAAFRPRRIAFASSNPDWGGSEELWSTAAALLAEDGHQVSVLKGRIFETEPRIRRLRALGVPMTDFRRLPWLPRKVQSALTDFAWPVTYAQQMLRLRLGLRRARPELVVISQGSNTDSMYLIKRVRRLGLSYVIVCQKASDLYWPGDRDLDDMRVDFTQARACYFVSEHNLHLTEEMIGRRLANAAVVRNPFLVPWQREEGWPDASDGLRLACVGRLYPRDKGQDMLLRVLARDTWRQRPVHVTVFGTGQHEQGLRAMADLHGLTKVTFGGFAHDSAAIWRDHHALILASRAEGLPLVIVEAMLSGRVTIATDVAGAREVVTDNVNGFLAAAPTEDALDEAMERAWQRRDEWRAIGDAAARDIRELVPSDPPRAFADLVLSHLQAPAASTPGPAALSEAA
jgi:glycosyltransferase involved in cell wall biosynthesis